MKISVFLPCRAGSERVPHKNTRIFADIEGGLLKIKLQQLVACNAIDSIVLSTNDEEVIQLAETVSSDKIKIDRRPEHLATSSTSTDDLVKYVPTIITEGAVLWTHVTSPFIDGKIYEEAIDAYRNALSKGDHDSLMSVTALRTFIWNKEGAVNYDRNKEKWPRTQTIEPLYEINSGIFLADIDIYRNLEDRIGKKPFLFENNDIDSFDIDWEEDFFIAEAIYKKLRS
ncbi:MULTISPECIES: cytidylyltransferase domain-containing protein [unclassified Dysgonomonas]|uniref:acylneuraminate cytidylyltransferase family protein n=1 Tax=unclassified Dysgonomonas TaxID=2630389 RepID=UPI00068013E2|nr:MULTISPECIES: acylneuraminate cytidylyltransferase family protein [unclassified Dysgonomonas]MBD8349505.1 acylneuraminate cytidylyltransferase family protein [Dysgonomonas sp. HGC4]MBF0577894.1 acylneuraminate cytidylyltransferase family protein [Dysgonomonas sp. GY617]